MKFGAGVVSHGALGLDFQKFFSVYFKATRLTPILCGCFSKRIRILGQQLL